MEMILGPVMKVKPGYGDPEQNPSYFTIRSCKDNQDYLIKCPFFCPAHKDDSLCGVFYFDPEILSRTFLQPPSVQLPSDRERIKQAFLIGLRGVYVKPGALDQLYQFFQERTLKSQPKLKPGIGLEDLIVESIVEYMDLPCPEIGLSNILDPKSAEKLVLWWKSNYTLRRLYLLGLTKREIRDSCDRGWDPSTLFGQLIINPMVVETVAYDKAVNIGAQRFIPLTEKDHECGRIVRFVDTECAKYGWMCYPMYSLKDKFPLLIELQDYLKTIFKCEIRYNFLYIRHQAETENTLVECLTNNPRPLGGPLRIPVSSQITEPIDDSDSEDEIPPEEWDTIVRETEIMPSVKNQLTSIQGAAVSMVLSNTVSVITGPAGTGKTTVISQLVEELELRNIPYLICTPTGKASARLKEVVRRTERVMTLHMFLSRYDHIRDPIGTLIVDEASMVNNTLAARTLRRLSSGPGNFKISIVLVGDKNQLQPIEPGDLFNQLLISSTIPRTVLTQDHRRAKKGVLYTNMRRLAKYAHQPDRRTLKWGEDTHLFHGSFAEVYDLFETARMKYGIDNVTVVCPYNDESRIINQQLQDILIPPRSGVIGLEVKDGFGSIWRVGARVMMLENRYDIHVMNGEQGIITKINNGEPGVWVLFQDRNESVIIPCYNGVTVPNPDVPSGGWEDRNEQPLSTKLISLSWCLTVDKSQGSQWNAVIFFIPNRQRDSGFVNWKRLYTGISRSKEELFIITEDQDKIYQALSTDPPKRYDNLARRLNGEQTTSLYVNPNRYAYRPM